VATLRKRSNGHWQARVRKANQSITKTFINKVDAERSAKSVMFRYLTDIGNHCDMFYKKLKTRGRPPLGYKLLDLADPEQLALAIRKILPRQ
jgi:hypothetical protein